MSGYQETLTDPSYHRQVVVATAPHIGNTGWNDEDDESGRIWVAGYVVRDAARRPVELAVPALAGRRAARPGRGRHVRRRHPGHHPAPARARGDAGRRVQRRDRPGGAAGAGPGPARDDRRLPGRPGLHRRRRTPSPRHGETAVPGGGGRPRHQVDDPAPDGRARHRGARGPGHARPSTRSAPWQPDGVFFSNGPGDPGATDGPVDLVKATLAAGIPFFGICFGNQLFGRALGFGTYKLAYGHRGINQPVMDLTTRRVEVTAHNHGFAVDAPLDGRDADAVRAGPGQPRRPERQRGRGPGAARRRRPDPRLLGAVPPRGRRRPARRQLPVRPVRRRDDRMRPGVRVADAAAYRHLTPSWSSAPARS